MIRKIGKLLPGAALALGIAVVARLLERLEEAAGLHFIGASVIAMFLGMLVNAIRKPDALSAPGIRFTSKKILKFAIILLGASLNIRTVLTVGRFSLTVMLFTLATCFGLGALIGRALGLNWKTSSLINAGTGICGGSAIAAIAPVIEASDMDIAYGLSATFLFDTVMVVVFPLLGRWMGLSDAAVKVSIRKIFPYFILGFLAMSALTSLGWIPAVAAAVMKRISKFLMVAALGAIGLNTDFRSLCRSGAKPMLHGFLVSLLVVLVAIGVEYAIGVAPAGTL